MATIFGTVTGTWPAFGVNNSEVGTIVMNTKSVSYESEDAAIQNESGDTIVKAKYDPTDKFSFDATITLPGHLQDTANGGIDIRDAFLVVNDVHGNVRNLIMDSATINEDNTDFVKITGEGTYYPSVDPVVTLDA